MTKARISYKTYNAPRIKSAKKGSKVMKKGILPIEKIEVVGKSKNRNKGLIWMKAKFMPLIRREAVKGSVTN